VITWPHIEIIDFTCNKLNDFYEIFHLINGNIVRKETIKIIAVKGNQFYNYYQASSLENKSINNEIDA